MYRFFILSALILAFAPGSAAYELWLDIDIDGDPATINDFTWDSSCTVNLVVAPSGASEELWSLGFGLGGSCIDCEGVFQYGTGFDLGDLGTGTWECHPYFAGTVDFATSIDCPDDPGFHAVFSAESIIDCCFVIEEPIVFATFQAWKIDTPGCNVPANLAVMEYQGYAGVWNYIQIGGPAISGDAATWSAVKALYR